MKKILLAVLVLVSINAVGQFPGTQSMANASTKLLVNGGLEAKRGIINGVFTDTSTANSDHIDFYNGAQIYTRSDRNFWLRDSVLNMWIRMAKFSDVGSGDNIYNSNGTLEGNRILTGLNNTRSLTFDSLDYFTVNRAGVVRMYMSSTMSSLYSPANGNSIIVNNSYPYLNFNGGVNYLRVLDTTLLHERASYEGNIHSTFYPYSLVDKSYVDSISGNPYRFGKSGEDVTPAENRSVNFTSTYSLSAIHTTSTTLTSDSSLSSIGVAQMAISRFNNNSFIGTYYRSGSIAAFRSNWNSGNIYSEITNIPSGSQPLANFFRTYDDSIIIRSNNPATPIYIHNVPYNSGSEVVALGLDTLTNRLVRKTGGGGSGVTSVGSGFGTNFSTITTTGSVVVDSTSGGVTSWVRTKFIIDSLQAAGWGQQAVTSVSRYQYYMDVSQNTQANFFPSATGTGASSTISGTSIATGWISGRVQSTGTTSSGRAYIFYGYTGGYSAIAINSSYRYNYGAKVRLEDLSDGTETYEVYSGFGDEANIFSSVVDGVGFRYTHADSSGNWIMWTKSNSTLTEDATTTAAADTDYELEVTVFGGVASYYINKVLVGTISSNIPTGTTRATSTNTVIRKTNGTVARLMYVEWVALGKQNF